MRVYVVRGNPESTSRKVWDRLLQTPEHTQRTSCALTSRPGAALTLGHLLYAQLDASAAFSAAFPPEQRAQPLQAQRAAPPHFPPPFQTRPAPASRHSTESGQKVEILAPPSPAFPPRPSLPAPAAQEPPRLRPAAAACQGPGAGASLCAGAGAGAGAASPGSGPGQPRPCRCRRSSSSSSSSCWGPAGCGRPSPALLLLLVVVVAAPWRSSPPSRRRRRATGRTA